MPRRPNQIKKWSRFGFPSFTVFKKNKGKFSGRSRTTFVNRGVGEMPLILKTKDRFSYEKVIPLNIRRRK